MSDRRALVFLVGIFVLIAAVFGLAYYEFLMHPPAASHAPVRFTAATMVRGNATFNVTAADNGPYARTGFLVNLSVNNFGARSVALAPSGRNATLSIGPDVYRVMWIDQDHDGAVSVGDVFWVTGDGARLPTLSYCVFDLVWRSGGWTAMESWQTSPSIV